MTPLLTPLSLAAATLVSEDAACIAAGLLVAQGALGFWPVTAACFFGILTGDLLLVLAGRALGRPLLARAWLRRRVSPEAVARAERWLARRGPALVLTSRFVPGTRLPTYLAVGVLRAPLGRFLGWFALACAVWTPLLVGAAALLGGQARGWLDAWGAAVPALVLGGLLAWLLARLGVALATWRGWRLLLGRWRRLTRWEFWPRWAVYPPVVLWILWLGARHRGLTLFTAANPGIGAGGGLVGESKSEILHGLAGAGGRVARWALIAPGPAAARRAAVEQFMAAAGLAFPVVLKPDAGERGDGVVIARDAAAVAAKLTADPGPLIAQAFVPGVEFGVFYTRLPSAARGEIFGVTEKRMVGVTGDGARTLEELILADDRAVCLAPLFLEKFAARLDDVPAAGEPVALSELGTHCRGALFLDGARLVTPALADAVERVSRTFDGFHFGRYDVRTASVEAFQRGEFTVIELNGLTSEATGIYDPRHSVWHGWRMLCRQWTLAFAIAAVNRAAGARVLTLRGTFRVWRDARRGPKNGAGDGAGR